MNKKVITILTGGISIIILLGILFYRKDLREPIIFSEGSASYAEKSLDDLIYEADAIVIGKFISAFPSQWNTPNGKLPNNATIQTVYAQHLYIYTEYTFEVQDFLKGKQPQSSIIIRTFGGQVGSDIMTVSSTETYKTGQVYLLFLYYDPRLAKAENPGPFLVYRPRVYSIENDNAVSSDEWGEQELRDYIVNSPFNIARGITFNTPASEEIMRRIKAGHDLEVEAKKSSEVSKLSDIFINDARFPLYSDRLEFVRTVTNNSSVNSAGYLDFKMAYIQNGFDPKSGYEVPIDSIWIKFVSATINNDFAIVIYDIGSRRKEVALIRIDGVWYVAGAKGITSSEDNMFVSILVPNIPITSETTEIIQTIESIYQDLILQFLSIEVNGERAVVYLYDGYRAMTVSLRRADGKWQITETKGTGL